MGVDSDEALWSRVLAGDEREFGVIWDRHNRRIFRHLLDMGNSVPDSEDLTATTFLELWRHRESVAIVGGSILPWLIVTARNVARNAARARRRYRAFLASLPPVEYTPDPAERFADRNDAQALRLRAVIAKCRPVDAALLAMTSLEGFSAAEAGAVFGLSEAATKMRISRLRARLRVALVSSAVPEEAHDV